MKQRLFFYKMAFMLLLLILLGCSEERKDDYKGVSELIADRNQARSLIRKQPAADKTFDQDKPAAEGQNSSQQKKTDPDPGEISSVILYEEKVKIYSDSSDKIIAKGIAYINKQGQIVRLKIVND